MKKQILQKDRVFTCGRGERRVVLCYDSGLCYQYDNPAKITGQFVSSLNAWVTLKRPYYSTGGWGNGPSGDDFNYHLQANTVSLIAAINGQSLELNQSEWLSDKDVIKFNRAIAAQNKANKKLKDQYSNLLPDIESLPEIKLESNWRTNSGKGKGHDVFRTLDQMQAAIEVFKSGRGKAIKVESYLISANKITQGSKVVAFRNKSLGVVMNSEVLSLTTFEREFLGSESIIQNAVKEIAKLSIPFNVLQAAELKLEETNIIEQGPQETFALKNNQTRHFTGYLLLENKGRKFLMDVDRIEIEHGLFNVFFVEVDSSVKTRAEAYESMKPEVIKNAEKLGVEYKRQGEWFFLPTGQFFTVKNKDIYRWLDPKHKGNSLQQFAISHGKGRPNNVYRPCVDGKPIDNMFCGIVTHQGREHHPLILGHVNLTDESTGCPQLEGHYSGGDDNHDIQVALYQVIGNTTVSNFTITGDVD